MPKVYCADYGCKFLNDNGICTAKKVALSWNSVYTVHEGRKEFHKCKTRESSETEQRMKVISDKLSKGLSTD